MEVKPLSLKNYKKNAPRWVDENKEEVEEIMTPQVEQPSKTSKDTVSESPSVSSQLNSLDPRMIYWNVDEEIYIHASGMYFSRYKRYILHW